MAEVRCRRQQHCHDWWLHLGLWFAIGASWPSSSLAASGIAVPHPEEFVNVLSGAAGGQKNGQHHSTGNTLPLVALPWGFNHWAPQTTNDRTSWWFDADADTFRGIRCTHQPSPWIGDYGFFVLRPFMGYAGDAWLGFTSYRAASAVRPWQIDLHLGPRGIHVELTPTKHGAIFRATFPPTVPADQRKVCAWVPQGTGKDEDEKKAKSTRIPTGSCRGAGGGINLETRRFTSGLAKDAALVLYVRLEADGLQVQEDTAEATECIEEDIQYKPLDMPHQTRSQESDAETCQKRCARVPGCAHFTFWPDGGCHLQDEKAKAEKAATLRAGPPECTTAAPQPARQCCFLLEKEHAEVRLGSSFISEQQALRNLDEEVGSRSFDELSTTAREAWRSELLQVEVLDAGPASAATLRRLEVFYSCLYRALLFPRRLEEATPSGLQHWSPYDGRVHAGIGVTDNGFWDTFRTVYPLLTLAYPGQLGQLLEGWLNAYRAGGWLPKWASPGYRDSMVGTFADVVLADAILKNISGFDVKTAWEALKKDAFEHSTEKDTSRGKFGLQQYINRGYIPIDIKIGEACSRTLDFAFADAAAAAVAARLGEPEAEVLSARSLKGLQALYDEKTGLMGHRLASGAFKDEPAETWGDCFTEGSAWHHSFPPFNLGALSELHGGPEKLLDKLHALFVEPGEFRVGSYKVEIHEMREMRMLGLGQYAHNNQPVHHLPFLFALLGDRNTTARLVRQILATAYSPEGFAGDEDNGEMGSWFVLSALGLYAVAPGVSEAYVLSSVPLFPLVHLRELDITIEAPAAQKDSPALAEVLWKGQRVEGPELAYSALAAGGVLRFHAGNEGPVLHPVVSSLRGVLDSAVRRARTAATRQARRIPSAVSWNGAEQSRSGAGTAKGEGAGSAVALASAAGMLLLCCAAAWRRCGRGLAGTVEKPD